MSEDYRIVSQPHGEPRSAGEVGVRVRVQLSGRPSRRWSRDLGARLTRELIGHPGVAHLRVNVSEIVQGDEIVLDGIEDRETPALAEALHCAVDAANRSGEDNADSAPNVTQPEADAVASHVPLNESGDAATTGAVDRSRCPQCGHPLSLTTGDRGVGDQLAVGQTDCPGCGARLVRDVDGHVDRGWRLAH